MRRVRYQVACSLDGYIADPDGGFDWIPPEPPFDFEAHFAQFDTLVMGRHTYATIRAQGQDIPDKEVLVASRKLKPEDHPAVVPVLLGDGIPLLPSPSVRRRLSLVGHRVYPGGLVLLEYAVERASEGQAITPVPSRRRGSFR